MEEAEDAGEKKRVCVTGAGGFVGSWLVKLLLSKGYIVHATVRDPSDDKNTHLKKLEKASVNLQLFKADLLDFNAFATAIAGCQGVFHVASPVPFTEVPNPEVEVVSPAVTGTLNILKACSKVKVNRVVVVSSAAAVKMNPKWPKNKVMDESCWSDNEYCRTTENWYCLSKTLAECEAVDYAGKHGLDVVTFCPCLVVGPLLRSTINPSSLILINMLKGNHEFLENEVRHIVDVRDVASALLLVYENPEASGRYICGPHVIKLSDFVDMLKVVYPNTKYSSFIEVDEGPRISSEKLKMLGWKYRPLIETLLETVECYKEYGILNRN